MTELHTSELIMTVLKDGGYESLPKPLVVAGTEFNFEAAARGAQRSHDLVIITTDRLSASRRLRLIAGLARSLDLMQSKRPVTLVNVGRLSADEKNELERHARVLQVNPTTLSRADVERSIAVLLPLDLPTTVLMHGGDPVTEVLGALGLGPDTAEHLNLVRAAIGGADEVQVALRDYINDGIVATSPGGFLDV